MLMSKKSKKLMKIVNIEDENFHIFWTTWGISMKLSGKKWFMIMIKVTENRASPFLWKKKIRKTTGERQTKPPAFLGLFWKCSWMTASYGQLRRYIHFKYISPDGYTFWIFLIWPHVKEEHIFYGIFFSETCKHTD